MEALRAAGIFSLRELLYYLPKGYQDTRLITPIIELAPMVPSTIRGAFKGKAKLNRFKGLASVTATFKDETGSLQCIWYNQSWMKEQLVPDEEMILYGKLEVKNGKKQMVNPRPVQVQGLIPIYKPLPSVPSKTFAGFVDQALPFIKDVCRETLPEGLIMRYGLMDVYTAIEQIHQPQDSEMLQKANRRMAFEKALMYMAGVSLLRSRNEAGVIINKIEGLAESYWQSLTFEPTMAQQEILDEIIYDMAAITPMSRLVQGDVGCGKTAIAFGALLACVKNGFQGAMMAPTEILATQHYQNALEIFGPMGIGVGLLHGGIKGTKRKEALLKILNGEWQIIIGTHALISKGVEYKKLGLVITDEQHRFGVSQRTALIKKANGITPNVLVMSATPIPRTLALILYGDLDISIVSEMPKNRKKVETRLVPQEKRKGMYEFIRQQVSLGQQVYIVCPLVEDSEEMEDVKAAQSQYKALKKGELSDLKVGLTYGNQPPLEKAGVIDAFAKGEIDVLVSTTVIEVGVNVPNATVMVIEDAERFGLSQLHQLRGRVGRGSAQSWCFLLAEPNERLKTIAATNDGFVIAQKDLELRGPGDMMGTRQSGQLLEMDLFYVSDARLLDEVSDCLADLRTNTLLRGELAIIEAHARNYVKNKLEHISFN